MKETKTETILDNFEEYHMRLLELRPIQQFHSCEANLMRLYSSIHELIKIVRQQQKQIGQLKKPEAKGRLNEN